MSALRIDGGETSAGIYGLLETKKVAAVDAHPYALEISRGGNAFVDVQWVHVWK